MGNGTREVRTFATTATELLVLRDWLERYGVTHVAMESTGVYWKGHEPSAHRAE